MNAHILHQAPVKCLLAGNTILKQRVERHKYAGSEKLVEKINQLHVICGAPLALYLFMGVFVNSPLS